MVLWSLKVKGFMCKTTFIPLSNSHTTVTTVNATSFITTYISPLVVTAVPCLAIPTRWLETSVAVKVNVITYT